MFKMIMNEIRMRRELKAEIRQLIEVTARNCETDEIEVFTFDKIAYGNWMMGNDMCGDYVVIATKRV